MYRRRRHPHSHPHSYYPQYSAARPRSEWPLRLWLISFLFALFGVLCIYYGWFAQFWYVTWGVPTIFCLVVVVKIWLWLRLWWASYQARLSTYQHKTKVNRLVEATFAQTIELKEKEHKLRSWERTRKTQEYLEQQRTMMVSPKQMIVQRRKGHGLDVLYEPRWYDSDRVTEPVGKQLEDTGPAKPKLGMITAREVIAQRFMHATDIFFGFSQETGKPVYQEWEKIKSIFLAGLPGGGKTSSAVWLLIQVLGQGGRFVLVDKHARVNNDESLWSKVKPLSGAMIAPVGNSPESALRALKRARAVFDQRFDGGPIDYPLMVLVDEFTAIMAQQEGARKWSEVANYLAEFLEDLNTEGRKVGCYAVCIGQAANASRTGGTEVRDTFNTFLIHRMVNKQPGLLGFGDYKQEIEALETGEAFIRYESSGECLICRIPYVDSQTITWLAGRIQSRFAKQSKQLAVHELPTNRLGSRPSNTLPPYSRQSRAIPPRASAQFHPVSDQFQNFSTRPVSAPLKKSETLMKRPTEPVEKFEMKLPDLAKKVLELKKLKLKKVEILKELWGVRPGGTKAYTAANAEYEQIIESLVQLGYLKRVTKPS